MGIAHGPQDIDEVDEACVGRRVDHAGPYVIGGRAGVEGSQGAELGEEGGGGGGRGGGGQRGREGGEEEGGEQRRGARGGREEGWAQAQRGVVHEDEEGQVAGPQGRGAAAAVHGAVEQRSHDARQARRAACWDKSTVR